MYNTISPNKSGGCRSLINYLEKEESLTKDFAEYLNKENEVREDYFFNDKSKLLETDEVVKGIDGNCKGLKLNESRFFSLTLNPSEKEINHLERMAEQQIRMYQDRGIDILKGQSETVVKESLVKDMLKFYAIEGMDNYARNFGRDGIKSSKDIVWYGRVERDRYWKPKAKEVQHNKKIERQIIKLQKMPKTTLRNAEIKRLESKYILESAVRKGGKNIPIREMMPKSGNNYHIHVVVSRKDVTQKISLSPLAKARGNEEHIVNIAKVVDGKTVVVPTKCKVGFDRNNFTQSLENSFDKGFDYQRRFFESYEGRKTMKETPELYKAKEAEYNLQKGIGKDYEQGRGVAKVNDAKGVKQVEGVGTRLGHSLADKAGYSEIKEQSKPYVGVGKLGYQLVLSKQNGRKTITRVAKTASKQFMRGAGLSAAANPYMLVAQIGVGIVSSITDGGQER